MAPEQPEYGPRGYLPPRAAKRARKIVLREPMGVQWAIAAAVAGLLVLVAGSALLLSRTGPPGPPFVAVGELAQVDPRGTGRLPLAGGRDVLVVRGAGSVSAFAAPDVGVRWCTAPPRLVAEDGSAVWEPDGRLVAGGGTSLARLPAQVHQGVLYVDAAAPGTQLEPNPRGRPTPCPTTPS